MGVRDGYVRHGQLNNTEANGRSLITEIEVGGWEYEFEVFWYAKLN